MRRARIGNQTRGGDGNRTRVRGFAGPVLSHSDTPPKKRHAPSAFAGPETGRSGGEGALPPRRQRQACPRQPAHSALACRRKSTCRRATRTSLRTMRKLWHAPPTPVNDQSGKTHRPTPAPRAPRLNRRPLPGGQPDCKREDLALTNVRARSTPRLSPWQATLRQIHWPWRLGYPKPALVFRSGRPDTQAALLRQSRPVR